MQADAQYVPFIVPLVVIVLVLLRNRRERTLRPGLMWILPLLILFGAGSALFFAPGPRPGPAAIAGLAAALAAGAGLGWVRGRTIRVQRDADGRLTAQASPLGIVLILAVFAIRYPLSLYAQNHPEALPVSPVLLTDGFLLFAVGLILAQRIEILLRVRKLPPAPAAAA